MTWLAEEGEFDTELAMVGEVRTRERGVRGSARTGVSDKNIAVFLNPLIVRDTRKWFGGAELRLDAVVMHGGADKDSLFHPKTLRFPRVNDGDNLASGDNGLLIYYGRPAHFLAITVTLSRDRKDSDDLSALIAKESKSDEVSSLFTQLAASASPHVAAVQVGMQAAINLGEVAYQLIRQVSPNSLGLYRANWLANTHNFGIGRHPAEGAAPAKDFELAYDIIAD
ncbi:MAG TPA: hypothetical protein VGM82_01345 [Gemmatimonadaceae bacterium]|jgi:hypothetical protein